MLELEQDSTDISPIPFNENRPKKKVYVKKKKARCHVKEIPASLKYVNPSDIYQICGDIFLTPYQDSFVSEISFLNEFKMCSRATTKEMFGQNVLSIELEDKRDYFRESTESLFTCLEVSESPGILSWKEAIKNYSSIYSKVILKQSRKRPKSNLRRKFYAKVMQETITQTEALFTNFPCIKSKYRVRNHRAHLTEIIITESFINELGYDLEKFIDLVLSEGFPRIMNYETAENSYCLKTLIENYFKIEGQGLNIPELQAQLLMKDKYAKNVIYQNQILMNYEARTFGFDVILALTHKGEPYVDNRAVQLNKLNLDFIQIMAEREEERNQFLNNFYGMEPIVNWASYDKTCLIKELDTFDGCN